MKNRKGFTMVELLAVITIIGILTGIGVVSIQKANDRAKVNFYNSQRSTLTNAATSYLADHKDKYPRYVGQTSTITLEEMQTGKYVGEFNDQSKEPNSCNKSKTKVVVLRSDTNKFKYYSILNCNSITDKDVSAASQKVDSRSSSISKDSNTLTINIVLPEGYKIKKYSYVIRKTESSMDIRSNTVSPTNYSNTTTAQIDISDIASSVGYVQVYFITTNGGFGDFHS